MSDEGGGGASQKIGVEEPFASYILERRLAVGGMSEVFVARPRDRTTGRVVIKRLLPDLVEDDAVREAFELEASLHRRVDHPAVVRFFEYGTYAGEPYIVMEHVAGANLGRLLRRAQSDGKRLEPGLSVYIATCLCSALEAVHAIADEGGRSLGVVHRDVSPSNVLLSSRGEVKLGDFGIAQMQRSAQLRSSGAVKGKYAYLAPEQVAGESFDQRADLFSLAVVLGECLVGEPLFGDGAQLAVLLAIRDARIDTLRAAKQRIPAGLFEVVERALSKEPGERYATASELARALAPYTLEARKAKGELSGWVAYASDAASAARRLQSSDKRPAQTAEDLPCILRVAGREDRVVHLAKLIEQLATGRVSERDQVDFGGGFKPIHEVAMLARYLPQQNQTTARFQGPGVPDFLTTLTDSKAAEAFVWIAKHRASGALFAEPASGEDAPAELYFSDGKLVVAVSSDPGMLLGERLVSRGLIDRGELDLAVLVMHKYNGHLGDTIIGLGLADPLDVFDTLRAQGTERVARLFRWKRGKLAFYRGVSPARVDFRLDLDVATLLLAGLKEARTADEILDEWDALLDAKYALVEPQPAWARGASWPSVMSSVLRALTTGATPMEIMKVFEPAPFQPSGSLTKVHVLLALEACEQLGIVIRQP